MLLLFVVLFLFLSCAPTIPKEALQLSKESLKNRQLQTRRFDTDEKTLLSASGCCTTGSWDLTLMKAKLIWVLFACSKERDAKSAGQITRRCHSCFANWSIHDLLTKQQLIWLRLSHARFTLMKQINPKCQTAVRITFQRIVTNTQGQITRRECIKTRQRFIKSSLINFRSQYFWRLTRYEKKTNTIVITFNCSYLC